MERAQPQNFQPRNNNNRNSNWQRKGQTSEQRPPNPLTNLVDDAGLKTVLVKRGTKYPKRIKKFDKSLHHIDVLWKCCRIICSPVC